MKKTEILQLNIEALAIGGRGVARHPGGAVVFVNGGLPGDVVEARITRKRKRHMEASLLSLITPSVDRIDPLCKHAAYCGGCPLQMLAYAEQLKAKQSFVEEAWKRIGGVGTPAVEAILPCEAQTYYRNKMEFGFSDMAWHPDGKDADKAEFGLGQHPRGVFSKVFNLEECVLQSTLVAPMLAYIRQFVLERGGGAESVWHSFQHTGYWRFLVIREARGTGQRLLNIVVSHPGDPRAAQLAKELLDAFPGEFSSIVSSVNSGSGQTAVGDLACVHHGSGELEEVVCGRRFVVSPGSFFQTNTEQAERLYALTAEFANLHGGDRLLDLYCGTGSIGICLAKEGVDLTGFELVEEAVVAARRNAELNGLSQMRFSSGDVKDLLAGGLDQNPTVVIVDPPRAGLHPRVVQQLLEIAAPRLVYVSCNPVTQARDAALLIEGGYELKRLRPVDMFPHTAHVECVALMEKVR